MKKFDAYEFLKVISFERLSGSKEELKAAHLIQDEIKRLGGESTLESFEVDYSTIKEASLTIDGKEYNVTGVKFSGSTSKDGITKEVVYVENALPTNLVDVEDKIVIVNNVGYKLYEDLVKAKVAGFITMDGSLYDDLDNTDLTVKALRERHTKHGVIPGVCIRTIDCNEIILNKPKMACLKVIQDEGKANSHNVVSTILGTERPNEVIVFTAHFDSVPFSPGAWDNGTGSVTILDIYNRFLNNKPKRTLKFVWCGSEEVGLLGSKAFVEQHKEELKDYRLCVNVDMTGVALGKDLAVCTSELSLPSFIDYIGQLEGFPITTSQGVYSSDSTPFANAGVPAVSFARMANMGGVQFHSRRDVITNVIPEIMNNTTEFVYQTVSKLIGGYSFPVKKEIPDNMKKELDKYLGVEKNAK